MCLAVIRCAVENNAFVHVNNYVSKARSMLGCTALVRGWRAERLILPSCVLFRKGRYSMRVCGGCLCCQVAQAVYPRIRGKQVMAGSSPMMQAEQAVHE